VNQLVNLSRNKFVDDARPQAVMMKMYAQRGWSEKTTGKTQIFLQILFCKTTESSPM
jgi:hypothetical protein